jgi:endogenous inhibitor of DNA gyrase (YacG/DUF329 family)
MPLTPAEKVRRHRLRQAGKLPPLPTCPECGRAVISTRTAPLCSRCWKLTPEGKAADAERKRKARKRDAV